jgi:hypothetical protein
MDMTEAQDLIVDDRARGIFRVNRRVFTDPKVLEQGYRGKRLREFLEQPGSGCLTG